MNYSKHYEVLITRAKERLRPAGYTEWHHIVPKCLGGEDTPGNRALLTGAEHYIAHQLLVKMYPGNHKIAFAAYMMTISKVGRKNKLYEWLRKKHSLALSIVQKGRPMPLAVCEKLRQRNLGNQYAKGNKLTPEHRRAISKAQAGKVNSDKQKEVARAFKMSPEQYAILLVRNKGNTYGHAVSYTHLTLPT